MSRNIIVVRRNGKTTVYEGWRAWLMGAGAFLTIVAVLALIVFVMIGMALGLGALLLVLIPAALIMSGLAWLFGGRNA